VFTSREALPAPFNAERHLRELRQLEPSDAVALIERSLAAGDSDTRGATQAAGALEAQREEIEALVEAVQGHARTLALLGPELRRRGMAATQAALVELMEQMQRQVADLPAGDPRRREQSLFASVELSLRRLSAENRERVRVLGVFHGGVDLDVLIWMTGWEPAEVKGLAAELVGTGLATANPYGHLSLNPALCPFLQASLSEEEQEALTTPWLEAMAGYLGYLSQQRSQNTELAASLTLLELPNLFALLDRSRAGADPETTIDRATSLYSLLQALGKPRLLERVARVRDGAAAVLGEGWSHARFQASLIRIEQQLEGGQLREALAWAKQLLQQAQAVGEQAYTGADFDLAMASSLLGEVLQRAGHAQQALPLLQQAGRRYETIASQRSNKAAEGMASVCLTREGHCLLNLGRYDEAAATYQKSIHQAEQLMDQRGVAVSKGQLGTVHLFQKRYIDALEAYKEAREIFSRLNEPGSIAGSWHQMGIVHQHAGQLEAAEEAYNQSLAIQVRLGDQAGQASTLFQLGNLYQVDLQRPEQAVAFYQRAVEIFRALGDTAREGVALSKQADSLHNLQRYEEARAAISRAIQCKEAFGHAAEPWKTWNTLAAIETDDGNPSAAAEARQQARAAYLAYRRDGGENQQRSGRLALSVRQDLLAGMPTAAASLLQQLAADPGWAEALPFLTALQAITAGSCDRSLADDPGLYHTESAEVVLLIEALEAKAVG
jgi:tetratricopeptide (TPR) repeat protein